MKIKLGTTVVLASCFALAALSFAAAQSADNGDNRKLNSKTGSCEPTKSYLYNIGGFFDTKSATYRSLGTAPFTQGGSKASCVVVYMSPQLNTETGNEAFLRVTIDGDAGLPDEVVIAKSITTYETRSTSFVFPSIKPGNHKLKFEFRSSDSTKFVRVGGFQAVIQAAP